MPTCLKKHITDVRALQFFQILRFCVSFLISIVFTKSRLRTGEIGNYEIVLLIAGTVSFFWVSSMTQSLLAMYSNNKTFGGREHSPVFFNIFILFTLMSVAAAVFVFYMQPVLAPMFSLSGKNIPYMRILFVYIIFSCPANLVENFYLLLKQPMRLVRYSVISLSLRLLFVTIPVLLTRDIGYGLYGLLMSCVVNYAWGAVLVYRYSQLKFSKPFINEFLRQSFPLVLSFLLCGNAQYFDGLLISYKFDEATLAVFRYGARELPFVILLLTAFANAITPRFSRKEDTEAALKELKRGTNRLMHCLFPISMVIILLTKYLYPLVFNENFGPSATVFNIYMLMSITRFVVVAPVLMGKNDTKPFLYSATAEVVINVTLSLIFLNFWGINGVAIASVIGNFVEKIFIVIYVHAKYKIKIAQYLNVKNFLIYSSGLALCFVASLYI